MSSTAACEEVRGDEQKHTNRRKELEFELGVRLKLLDLEKEVVSLFGPSWWSLSSPWLGLGGQ